MEGRGPLGPGSWYVDVVLKGIVWSPVMSGTEERCGGGRAPRIARKSYMAVENVKST